MPPKRSLEEDGTQDGHPSKVVRQQHEQNLNAQEHGGTTSSHRSRPGVAIPSRPPIPSRSIGRTADATRSDNPTPSNDNRFSRWFNLTDDVPFAPDFATGLFGMRNLLATGVYIPNPQATQSPPSIDGDVEMPLDKDVENMDSSVPVPSAHTPSTSSETTPTSLHPSPGVQQQHQSEVNLDGGPGGRSTAQGSPEWIDHVEYRPNEYPPIPGPSMTSQGSFSSVPAHIDTGISPDIYADNSSRSTTPTPENPQDPAFDERRRYAGESYVPHIRSYNLGASGAREDSLHAQQPYTSESLEGSNNKTYPSSDHVQSGDHSADPRDKGKRRAEDQGPIPQPVNQSSSLASGRMSQAHAERSSESGNGKPAGQPSSINPPTSAPAESSEPQTHPGAMHSILTNISAITDVAGLKTNVERIEGTLNSVQGQLKDIQDKLPTGHGNVSTAETQARKRVKKPKTYNAPDPYINHKQRNRVKKVVRKHLLLLLKMESLNGMHGCAACRPLSEVQRLRFVAQQPGCIQITPEDFRLDFTQTRDSPFNQTAISIFANDLHDKITRDHWYRVEYNDPHPLDSQLVTVEYLEYTLYHHLKHVKEVWTVGGDPERISSHQKLAARGQRKQTLHKMRLDVVTRNPHLVRHRKLVVSMRAQADSSDEEVSQPTRPGMSRQYRRINPAWRSRELAQFLWKVDDIAFQQRQPKTGCRRIRGAAPRVRLSAIDRNQDTIAPEGLPRNCYDEAWLKTLWPHELRALNMLAYDHDFTIPEVSFGEIPGERFASTSNVTVEEVDEV